MTSENEYPIVEAFSHLSREQLEDMIQFLNNYEHPSAVVRAIVRECATLALRQKTEADQ